MLFMFFQVLARFHVCWTCGEEVEAWWSIELPYWLHMALLLLP